MMQCLCSGLCCLSVWCELSCGNIARGKGFVLIRYKRSTRELETESVLCARSIVKSQKLIGIKIQMNSLTLFCTGWCLRSSVHWLANNLKAGGSLPKRSSIVSSTLRPYRFWDPARLPVFWVLWAPLLESKLQTRGTIYTVPIIRMCGFILLLPTRLQDLTLT